MNAVAEWIRTAIASASEGFNDLLETSKVIFGERFAGETDALIATLAENQRAMREEIGDLQGKIEDLGGEIVALQRAEFVAREADAEARRRADKYGVTLGDLD